MFIFGILRALVSLYTLVVFVYALMSWFELARRSKAREILAIVVEPPLRPIRKILDPYQREIGIDFSPAVLILILAVIQIML